ncbi:MAG: LysR substrate-binding domain-containing protein [Gammaproteobacteria bacterium]|nr:LysR substrate-binding domain-containing protein [Gammaproteobacteria bacterium]
MKYQLPPLNGLLAFEAAARNENFARAAEELSLSQATISHRVRMLEKHLGYSLFERLPRGLKLTESGKAYVPSIRTAFEQIYSSTAGIFGRIGTGSLTIRAPVSYASLWLSPMIDHFLKLYPGISLRLISSVWADELASDETDIDFRLGYGNWENCKSEMILKEVVIPVCNPRLLNQKSNAFKQVRELAEFPLIHVMGIEDLWIKYLALADLKIDIDRRDIRVDSVVSALEIASSSDRIALLQKHFIRPFLESNRLVVPINIEMEIEQALYLVQPQSEATLIPEAILFREWLVEYLADTNDLGTGFAQ